MVPTSSGGGLDIDVTIHDWQNATKRMAWMGEFVKYDGFAISLGRIGGFRVNPQANNAVRFLLSSGSFSNVQYSVYGIR